MLTEASVAPGRLTCAPPSAGLGDRVHQLPAGLLCWAHRPHELYMRKGCRPGQDVEWRPPGSSHAPEANQALGLPRTTSSVVVIRVLSSSQSKGLQGAMRLMTGTRIAETMTDRMLPVSSGGLRPAVSTVMDPDMICVHASQLAMPHAEPTMAPARPRAPRTQRSPRANTGTRMQRVIFQVTMRGVGLPAHLCSAPSCTWAHMCGREGDVLPAGPRSVAVSMSQHAPWEALQPRCPAWQKQSGRALMMAARRVQRVQVSTHASGGTAPPTMTPARAAHMPEIGCRDRVQ